MIEAARIVDYGFRDQAVSAEGSIAIPVLARSMVAPYRQKDG